MFENFFEKLFKKCKKSKMHKDCKYISESIYFDLKNNVRLCPITDFGLIRSKFDGIWLDTDRIKTERIDCSRIIKSEDIHPFCQECVCLKDTEEEIKPVLKYVHLSEWKYCYANCTYCEYKKNDDFIEAKHYDVLPAIKQMIDAGLINTNTTFIFECGDACAHPEFDKIIYFLLNYECKNIIIKTSGLKFCQSIADVIAKNKGEVHISYDSGTRFMYEQIKRLDKFNDVVNNTKRYLAYQIPNEKRVALSYKMLNTINDNEKELLEWFILARDMGVKKLTFDIELRWYNQIRYSIPKYLKSIVLYIKNMADFNNIDLEFGEYAEKIYQIVKEEEIKE